jgi:hypothetical protein
VISAILFEQTMRETVGDANGDLQRIAMRRIVDPTGNAELWQTERAALHAEDAVAEHDSEIRWIRAIIRQTGSIERATRDHFEITAA